MTEPLLTTVAERVEPATEGEWAAAKPYVLPIVVFAVFTALEGYLPASWYVAAYGVKVLVVTALLVSLRLPLAEIRFDGRVLLPSVLVGLAVFVMWVGVDKLVPYPHLGERTAFNPFELGSAFETYAFLAVRLFGLVLMVPVMEEIFWRSFLLRYLTNTSFQSLRVGEFSTGALLIVTAAFAIAHPEWLVAALTALAYAFWIRRTGSLLAVIVAHAVTNAALGAYVLVTRDWVYW